MSMFQVQNVKALSHRIVRFGEFSTHTITATDADGKEHDAVFFVREPVVLDAPTTRLTPQFLASSDNPANYPAEVVS